MRGGPLSDIKVVDLLRPFIVTSWHGAGEAEMPADVRAIYTGSPLSKDPNRSNMFSFVLNSRGEPVHEFHGLTGRGGPGRSDWKAELAKAAGKLGLKEEAGAAPPGRPVALPDLPAAAGTAAPAGVRLYILSKGKDDPSRSRTPVIEVVPMTPEQWQALYLPDQTDGKTIEAGSLRSWLVHLYPAAIRTADQKIPFRNFRGELKLEPAGADAKFRYALLRGKVRLTKGEEADAGAQSAFEGNLEVRLTYLRDKPQVHSLRGIIEGNYLYRIRGNQPMPLQAAIESRPE